MPATIKHHESQHDWCHLCGNRSDTTADVWWAENAEHDGGPVNQRAAIAAGRYLRACVECAERVVAAADPKRVTLGEAVTERDDARDEADAATCLAMDLANALALAHAGTHPLHIAEPVDSCDACSALARARRWSR